MTLQIDVLAWDRHNYGTIKFINIKTNIIFHQALVTLADFGYLFKPFGFIVPKHIWYLRFYY